MEQQLQMELVPSSWTMSDVLELRQCSVLVLQILLDPTTVRILKMLGLLVNLVCYEF
jgi:hypothetical protein